MRQQTKPMKARFILMGCIVTGLGSGLMVSRGFSMPIAGLLGIGVVLLLLGILWK